MNVDEVVQKLDTIIDYSIDLVSDGWYTVEHLCEEIKMAVENDS